MKIPKIFLLSCDVKIKIILKQGGKKRIHCVQVHEYVCEVKLLILCLTVTRPSVMKPVSASVTLIASLIVCEGQGHPHAVAFSGNETAECRPPQNYQARDFPSELL